MTGGVLGIHWTSVIGLGWRPLASGRGGATCWESCCLKPTCSAVWSLGGRCVLLSCSQVGGCSIAYLPQPYLESLGLLQQLSKSTSSSARRRRRVQTGRGSAGQRHSAVHHTSTVSQQNVICLVLDAFFSPSNPLSFLPFILCVFPSSFLIKRVQ